MLKLILRKKIQNKGRPLGSVGVKSINTGPTIEIESIFFKNWHLFKRLLQSRIYGAPGAIDVLFRRQGAKVKH